MTSTRRRSEAGFERVVEPHPIEVAVEPEGGAKLGSLLHEIGRRAKVTDDDVQALEKSIEDQRENVAHGR